MLRLCSLLGRVGVWWCVRHVGDVMRLQCSLLSSCVIRADLFSGLIWTVRLKFLRIRLMM